MQTLEFLFSTALKASLHGGILIGALLVIQFVFRNQLTPRWRHALWFILLIRLAIPATPSSPLSPLNLVTQHATPLASQSQPQSVEDPVTSSIKPATQPPTAVPASSSTEMSGNQAVVTPTQTTPPRTSSLDVKRIAAVIWVTVGLYMFARLLIQNRRFTARVSRCQPVSSEKALSALTNAAKTLQMAHLRLEIIETEQVRTPCILGLRTQRLLLPKELVATLSTRELEWVFLHELSHLKRHDIQTSWLLSILQCVHWFNPLVWFAFDQMRVDRELATDDLVLQHTDPDERFRYGDTIIKLLNQMTQPKNTLAGVVGIIEGKQRIKQRIERIANFSKTKRGSILALCLCLGVMLTFMLDAKSEEDRSVESGGVQKQILVRTFGTEQPIANSKIELRVWWWNETEEKYESREQEPFTAQTDSEGIARIDDVPSDARRLVVKLSHSNYLNTTKLFDSERKPMPQRSELYQVEGQLISGRVTDGSNRPIENAQVSIQFPAQVRDFYVEAPKKPIRTDSSGLWTTRSVPPTASDVFIHVTHPEYGIPPRTIHDAAKNATSYYRTQSLSLATLVGGNHVIQMQRGGILRGTVLNQQGSPIPKARIELRSTGLDSIETDERGAFQFGSALTGPVNGVITKKGFSPFEFTLNVNTETAPQEYRLQKGSALRLSFLDQAGDPIEGVRIHVTEWSGKRHPFRNQSKYSDDEGSLTWANAPEGELTIDFLKNGFRSIRDHQVNASEALQVIRMERALQVQFEVMDLENNPIPSFTIDRGQPRQIGTEQESIHWSPRDRWTGTNGKAQTTESDPVVFKSQTERSYVYRVEAPGYQSAESRIVEAGEYDVTLKFQLEKSLNTTRRLEHAEGHALPSRTLWLLEENSSYSIDENMISFGQMGPETLQTDAAGNFQLPPRNSTQYILGLFDDGFVFAPDTQPTPFIVEPWSRIEGTWTEDGQPTEGQNLGFTLTERFHTSVPNINFMVRRVTDADGKFAFPRVPPKELDILNWTPVGKRSQTGRYITTITGEPGTTQQLAIGLPRRHRIEGQVKLTEELKQISDIDGSMSMIAPVLPEPPLPEAAKGNPDAVRQWYKEWYQTPEGEQHRQALRKGNSSLYLEPDGSFQTSNILPGRYRLQLHLFQKRDPSQPRPVRNVTAYAVQEIEITSNSPDTIELGEIELNRWP